MNDESDISNDWRIRNRNTCYCSLISFMMNVVMLFCVISAASQSLSSAVLGN